MKYSVFRTEASHVVKLSREYVYLVTKGEVRLSDIPILQFLGTIEADSCDEAIEKTKP